MLRSLTITITLLCATAAFAEQAVGPVDTRAWRIIDALDELFDAKSTPLARRVACARLVELGTGDWALRLAANYDASPEVRAAAWESSQILMKLRTSVEQLHDRAAPEKVRLAACDQLKELGEFAAPAAPALRMAALMDPSDDVRQRAAAALRSVLIELADRGFSTGGDEIASSLNPEGDDNAGVRRPRPTVEEAEISAGIDLIARARQGAAWQSFLDFRKGLADVPQQSREMLVRIGVFPRYVFNFLIDAVQSNIDQLTTGTTDARYQAALRLAKLGPLASPAIPALTRALKDGDADIRDVAARVLGTREAIRIARRGRLIDQLSADDVETRVAGARALAADHFATAAVMQTMVEAMKAPPLARNGLVAAAAHSWLEEIDINQAAANLLKQSKDPLYRLIATIAAKILAAGSVEEKVYADERAAIVVELEKRVAQSKSSVGVTALRQLGELGIKPIELIDVLNAAAVSDNAELRYRASQMLIEAGDAGFPGWAAMLKDPRAEVRGLALSQVSQLGPRAQRALTAITALLKDRDAAIRRMSAAALGTLGPIAAESLDPLLAMQTDPDADVREQSLMAARRIAPDDPRVARAIHQLLRDPSVAVRERAREQVPILQGHKRPDPAALLAQLRSQDPITRRQAAKTMADEAMVPDDIAVALLKAVDQGDFAVREGLAQGIEQAWAAEIEVDAALKKSQEGESNPARRAYARAALRALGLSDKKPSP